jgi:hypothetical protein
MMLRLERNASMPSHAPTLKTLGVMAALLLTPAAALAAPVSSTVLVDRPAGFGSLPFDGVSAASIGKHALSADGRYVGVQLIERCAQGRR